MLTRTACIALATGSAIALPACGGSDSSSSYSKPAAAATTAASTTVKMSADPTGALKFTRTKLTAKAGTVTVAMLNPAGSGVPHGIAVEGNGVDRDGRTVQPGGTSTDKLELKPGTYELYCPVPGHKAAGMTATLTVTK
jgi:uncharacterized cupredoxin-like copper-binding protein